MAVTSVFPSENEGPVLEEKSASRSRVRIVGSRIYDSEKGKCCHQCRQKTMDRAASCKNMKKVRRCAINLCYKCLLNRYGEKVEEVALLDDWQCPKCRGICNCSICMKKRGKKPTGILAHAAKATGFSSVSEMLQVRGPENVQTDMNTGVSSKKQAATTGCLQPDGTKASFEARGEGFDSHFPPSSPPPLPKKKKQAARQKLEAIAASPMKAGKENSCDGEGDSKFSSEKSEQISNEKESKRIKLEGSKELHNGSRDAEASVRKCRSKKNKRIEEASKAQAQKNSSCRPRKKEETTLSECYAVSPVEKHRSNVKSENAGISHDLENDDSTELHYKKHGAIPLPQGTILTTVGGINLDPKDIGHALQFIEFCAAFEEVLGIDKGKAESVIREIIRGQSRLQQHSSIVQIHSQLLTLIKEDRREKFAPLSEGGQNSWFKALGKCVSQSHCPLEEFPSEFFDKGVDVYNELDSSKKLKILNFLCDEALCTTALRSCIEGQKSNVTDQAKEARETILTANEKKKHLKQKMLDERAKLSNAAPSSFSEYESRVSEIKREADEAQKEFLEAKGMLLQKRQRSDAVRTDPIVRDVNGRAFWRLRGYTGEPDVLMQDLGTSAALEPDEKWLTYDAEQKQDLEKYISSSRPKRHRAKKGEKLQQ